MKKKIAIIVTIIMCMGIFFTGCKTVSNTDKTSDSSTKEVLKIGLEDSFPPMEYRNEKNELIGFDIDMANEIGKRLDKKIEFVSTAFEGITLSLKSGKFDAIISGLSITDERKKEIAFSEAYLMGGQMIVVKKGNTTIKKAEDLKGKVVACELGATSEHAASQIKEIKELKKYDKVPLALQDLSIGRVDAVVIDEAVGGYYISKQKDSYTVLDEKLTEEPMGIGFKKEDKELKESVQKVLDEMKKDGTMSKISEKWFGFDAYKNEK